MSITEVVRITSQPLDKNWKPYDTANSSHTKDQASSFKGCTSFENRSAIRKAKMTQVVHELKLRGLPVSGSAEERRTRLMDNLFPRDTKSYAIASSSDEEPIVEKSHKRKSNRWGKMLRKSLGSFQEGKISFEDTFKKETDLPNMALSSAELVVTANPNVTLYKFNNLEDIEKIFPSDKPVTQKKWSLSYGRQSIFTRLVPPLFVSFDNSAMKVKFEGMYKASKFPEEIENYWNDENRENMRNNIKERLLARSRLVTASPEKSE